MSMKRAPANGDMPVRLMQSRMSTVVPGAHSGLRPPAPLVSTMTLAPAQIAVRTPCTTWFTPWPSYRWVRPVKIAAVLPVIVETIRSAPP